MAPKNTTPEAAQEPVAVEGLEVSGGKVVAVPAEPEVTPPPAQMEPEKAASAAPEDQEVMANIGHLRVQTEAEKRVAQETDAKEDHHLRPAKEAHADAARLSVLVTVGTERDTADVRGNGAEDAALLVRTRLLFDWIDGQGVGHARGKEMDLPRNEAVKLIEEGRAERANPPEANPVELAMAEAKMAVMSKSQ